jgi:hypothetical protein
VEGVVTKNILKYLENIGLSKNILKVGLRAVLKSSIENNKTEDLKRKPMHGQFY